ncbi:MAG TPA: tail fiber domain-containing protein [Thermoanaerobaculia bacterium]|nr:tail fiber domain-containing protein [Thermoanaerobaculia bacterium]
MKRARILSFLLAAACCAMPSGAQTVIPEDLIVVGRACVGIDCSTTGEGGLDNLKLKHNNTRLLFEDTSTTTGFATTDWRLTANDSFTGGVSRFSIEDATAATVPFTIRGAAPSHSLFVSNLGRVGIGTSTPDARLDVEATGSVEIRMTATGAATWRQINDFDGFGLEMLGTGFRAVNVDPLGNMEIHGMLTEGSSRDLKTGFARLDAREILDRVSALPISLWSYKREGLGVRHLGPMAEDFYKAFGLGPNDKHVAPGDQASVALLAVQGLHQVVQEKDREIADLQGRLEALERRITELARGQ